MGNTRRARPGEWRIRNAVIDDLRTRLDAESEERRRTQAQLTDQRQKSEPEQSLPPSPTLHRRRWWPFGRPSQPPLSTARSPSLPSDAASVLNERAMLYHYCPVHCE